MDSIASAQQTETPNWPAIVAAFERSEQSAAAYCREHGIDIGQFRYWRRKLAGPAQVKPRRTKRSAFVAVQAELLACKITLPHGLSIACQQLPEPRWLGALLKVL
jgi:transposase-like protein